MFAILGALLCTGGRSPLAAQETDELMRRAEVLLGRPVTASDILRLLRETGLEPREIRDRLEREGFSRTAADPWLSVLEGRAERVPEGTDPLPLLQVLVELDSAEPGEEVVRPSRESPPPAERRAEDEATPEAPAGPPVFGRELFRRASSEFAPLAGGPVPPDYRVGPGDELVLVLTGDVEQAYRLTVTPEGWVVIPDVGRVFVSGRTLGDLEGALRERLGEAYSGLGAGPEATAFLDVSLGKLRANQVYVIGEVERPGAYRVSALGTALTALYRAGGPNESGSFREIVVNRGGREAASVDLYEYLLHGRAERDVRLEHGDVVFVPVARLQVEVDGTVRRPGIYELRDGETLEDLLRFAGGTGAAADLRHVQIERILPPEERAPGVDRAVLDIPMAGAEAGGRDVPLRNGDRITVFAVLEDVRNRVTISGAVWRPGTYGASEGMRLWDLVERAGGLLPDAYEGRAQIQRLEPNYTRRMIPVRLERAADGTPLHDPAIVGMDQVFVYAKRDLREGRVVSIGGWVQAPGVYPYIEGMTLRDLILKAGGIRTGTYLGHAEVSRVVISQEHTDTLTRRYRLPLDSSYVFDRPAGGPELAGDGAGTSGDGAGAPERGAAAPEGGAAAPEPITFNAPGASDGEFLLHNLDAVYVRKSPGFEPQQNVIVAGEVMLPGPYSLETRSERLTDLVVRAGGLTPEAYAGGLQLWRAEPGGGADTLTAAEIAGRTFGEELSEEERARLAEAGQAPERMRVRTQVHRTRVGVDFVRAMKDRNGPHNVLVEPNDSIYVPRYIPTVEVLGAVGVPTKVLYHRGAAVDHYINQAGGYAENADRGRTRVRYANGEVRTRGGGFLFFGGGVPDPDPGSVITVPTEPERQPGGLRITELVGILTSVMTAAATVIIATQ